MKERILQLRSEGKSYRVIQREVGCSRSLISYHCGPGQKEKYKTRGQNNPKKKLYSVLDRYKTASNRLKYGIKTFQSKGKEVTQRFTVADVLLKFGKTTTCYLTGTSINLLEDEYHLDHIVPLSRGGESTLENLGITIPEANMGKSGLSVEEFIELCKKVVIHFNRNNT